MDREFGYIDMKNLFLFELQLNSKAAWPEEMNDQHIASAALWLRAEALCAAPFDCDS